ncbi:hypothetical protein PIB30_057021 [Stylosanthes scabra]|uniref:Uncharacterized protein n=1 Tax=Stylosanthes scabra TaxID=79078 RepID=A0ABU6RJV6_9FABA|nr:hypothetical protein [Stylosanthes scabra]
MTSLSSIRFIVYGSTWIVCTSFPLSHFRFLDAESLRKGKIPLCKDLAHQEGQVRCRVPPTQGQEGGRLLKSWELVPPSEGWMCEGDEVGDKEAIEDIPARVDYVKGIEVEGKDEEEEEEDPKMNDPCLLMVIVSRAMIFPAFGRLQLVQVSRVPHQL